MNSFAKLILSTIISLSLICFSSQALSDFPAPPSDLFNKTKAHVTASISIIEPNISKAESDLRGLRAQFDKEKIELVRKRNSVISETSVVCYNAKLKEAEFKIRISIRDWLVANQQLNKLSRLKTTALATNSLEDLEETHQEVLSMKNIESIEKTLSNIEDLKASLGINRSLASSCPQ